MAKSGMVAWQWKSCCKGVVTSPLRLSPSKNRHNFSIDIFSIPESHFFWGFNAISSNFCPYSKHLYHHLYFQNSNHFAQVEALLVFITMAGKVALLNLGRKGWGNGLNRWITHRKKELSSSGGGYPAINRMNSMYDFDSDPFFFWNLFGESCIFETSSKLGNDADRCHPYSHKQPLRIWTTKFVWSCWWVLSLASLLWWDHPTGGDHSNSGFDAKKFEGPDLVIPTTHPPCFKGLVSEEPVIGGVNSTHPTKKRASDSLTLSLPIPTHQHLSTFRLCFGFIQFLHPIIPRFSNFSGLGWWFTLLQYLSHAFHRWPGWIFLNHLTTRQFSRKVSPKLPPSKRQTAILSM